MMKMWVGPRAIQSQALCWIPLNLTLVRTQDVCRGERLVNTSQDRICVESAPRESRDGRWRRPVAPRNPGLGHVSSLQSYRARSLRRDPGLGNAPGSAATVPPWDASVRDKDYIMHASSMRCMYIYIYIYIYNVFIIMIM